MSRIVEAVNSMISYKEKIKCLAQDENLLWFSFDGKHKWSISELDGEYYLAYYPGSIKIEDLIKLNPREVDEEKSILYSTPSINTREARQSFRDLYSVCKEKLHDMDKVFDEIIGKNPEDNLPF